MNEMTNDCELKCGGFNHFINKHFDEFSGMQEHTIIQAQNYIAHRIDTRVALPELITWAVRRVQTDPNFRSDLETLTKWKEA